MLMSLLKLILLIIQRIKGEEIKVEVNAANGKIIEVSTEQREIVKETMKKAKISAYVPGNSCNVNSCNPNLSGVAVSVEAYR